MWIIPTNHPLFSVFVPEDFVASKEELNLLPEESMLSLMWRSSQLSLKKWSDKWKRVYWLPYLFGRMLKPSCQSQNDFVEKWISSLPDIHVSHSPMSVSEREKKIPVTSGHTSMTSQMQLGLFVASSKTFQDTLPLDMKKSKPVWKDLVTELNKSCSQRLKQARLTYEKDCLSLLWTTPCADDTGDRKGKYAQGGSPLSYQVKLWTTPNARDYKDTMGMSEKVGDRTRLDQCSRQVFHWARVTHNGNGKPPALNPAWVLQLMGTTIEKTFSEWQETELFHRLQKSHSDISSENTD